MEKQRKQRRYRTQCVMAPTFKLLESGFELFVPLVVARIIDVGIANGDRLYIGKQVLLMGALAAIGFLCTLLAQYFAARAAVGIALGLRSRLFSHVQRLSYADLEQHGTSALVTRLTQDVNSVQTGWNLSLRLLLRSPCIVFGAMIMAFTIDRSISLIFLGMILALSVVVFGIMLLSIRRYQHTQSRLDRVLDAVRQNLTGVRVMRAFGREKEEIEGFDAHTDALMRMQNRVGRLSALLNPLTYAIVNFAVIVLLYQGGVRVRLGSLSQGQVVALYNYLTQILIELVKLADLIITITKAVASYRRIRTVLQTEPSQTVQAGRTGADPRYHVEFQNVTFSYPQSEEPSLHDLSFGLARGKILGIVGGTGAGKSTLVNLISRFYDADSGAVFVDGTDVLSYDPKTLRQKIGVVPQKAVLFSGTVAENLRFGNPDATDEQLHKALATAQALDFVEAKEGGLDACVLAGGKNFSGGQRQRLTIARALAMQPEILILDDSASALDYATDARLRAAIAALPHRPTTVIVSQRTAAVEDADLILVLEDGEVVGMGDHAQLLESCAVYREIHDSQLYHAKGGAANEA